jgi:hypothetical protein
MLKSGCFLFLFSVYSFCFCQVQNLYEFPTKIPSDYVFDEASEYKKLSKIRVKGATSIDVANYAEMVSYGKTNRFESGKIYMEWNQIENYLNDILQGILPDSLKQINSKVYLSRSPYYNAFAAHDGSFYVNIGLLAEVENEAALSVILGHEIAHYINRDVQDSYFKNLKNYSKRNRNKSNLRVESAHDSQEHEHLADSLGFVLVKKAGYDIKYGLNNFYYFLFSEKESQDKKESKLKITTVGSKSDSSSGALGVMLSTHPEAKSRIDFLKVVLSNDEVQDKGVGFRLDKGLFHDIQLKARYETLSLLLEDNNNLSCTERAFKFYLEDPNDDTYVYYILESIRRRMYLSGGLGMQGFLTDLYPTYFNTGEGILNNLNFLIRDSATYENVKAIDLLESKNVAFNTYSEAFNYFKKIVIRREIKEGFLSLGLADTNKEKSAIFINKYLSFETIEARGFAKSFLSNELLKSLRENESKMFLIEDVDFIEDHFYGYHVNLIKRKEVGLKFHNSINKTMKKHFGERTVLSAESLRRKSFKTYLRSQEVKSTIYFFRQFKASKKNKEYSEAVFFGDDNEEVGVESGYDKRNLFVLKPQVWDYFMAQNISSFEGIEISSFDDHTAFIRTVGNTLLGALLLPLGGIYNGGSVGSNRYAYMIDYEKYDAYNRVSFNLEKTVHYKMKKEYLNNTIYHMLKEKDNE